MTALAPPSLLACSIEGTHERYINTITMYLGIHQAQHWEGGLEGGLQGGGDLCGVLLTLPFSILFLTGILGQTKAGVVPSMPLLSVPRRPVPLGIATRKEGRRKNVRGGGGGGVKIITGIPSHLV